jgi:hypothetical protein
MLRGRTRAIGWRPSSWSHCHRVEVAPLSRPKKVRATATTAPLGCCCTEQGKEDEDPHEVLHLRGGLQLHRVLTPAQAPNLPITNEHTWNLPWFSSPRERRGDTEEDNSVTPYVTVSLITFIKALIKDQIHWLISFLSKPKSKLKWIHCKFEKQIKKKLTNLESQLSFYELIYHPCAIRSFLFKVLQFLKISIKLHQILLNFQP